MVSEAIFFEGVGGRRGRGRSGGKAGLERLAAGADGRRGARDTQAHEGGVDGLRCANNKTTIATLMKGVWMVSAVRKHKQ